MEWSSLGGSNSQNMSRLFSPPKKIKPYILKFAREKHSSLFRSIHCDEEGKTFKKQRLVAGSIKLFYGRN
jgi:hypothetical protein